jgi:hypothetical protein
MKSDMETAKEAVPSSDFCCAVPRINYWDMPPFATLQRKALPLHDHRLEAVYLFTNRTWHRSGITSAEGLNVAGI